MAKLPKRSINYSERYNQLIVQADLAENSAVRGCMIIKPYGFAIRENIRDILDIMFKNTGHSNAYFPLLIPKSFLSREAAHVEGFAKECAVVTHHRLKTGSDGKSVEVDPDAKLDEELIIRPTSETIIWDTYKKWINSYRDLPLLINQRANIVRRELRTRPFLRTTEFLRQEGHTAHATKEEAYQESRKMLEVYYDFSRNFLAMDPVVGEKPEHDKFAGALNTFSIEAMMQDFKALQAGTSHFLGQNFAKAFDVTFTNQDNIKEYVRATSRGVSTRLMGGLIMSHSDDNGLVLPPSIAPIHVVIVPIYKTNEDLEKIKQYLQPLMERLEDITLEFETKFGNNLQHVVKNTNKGIKRKLNWKFDDDNSKSPGWKFNERELKGVPLRLTVGMRDLDSNTIELYKRFPGEKESITLEQAIIDIPKYLYKMQNNLLSANKEFRESNTYEANDWNEFKEKIEKGFVLAHWDGTEETADKIQTETKATIRCIPFNQAEENSKCIYSGNPSNKRVLFAKAY